MHAAAVATAALPEREGYRQARMMRKDAALERARATKELKMIVKQSSI